MIKNEEYAEWSEKCSQLLCSRSQTLVVRTERLMIKLYAWGNGEECVVLLAGETEVLKRAQKSAEIFSIISLETEFSNILMQGSFRAIKSLCCGLYLKNKYNKNKEPVLAF